MFDVRTALAQPVGLTRWQRLVLCAFVLVCLAVRVWWGVSYPSMIYPDNVFQSLEQAHRLVFGYGQMVQEYRLGLRNWLFPGSLAAVMWLCKWFSSSAVVYLAVIKTLLSGLSLIPVYVTYALARRRVSFGLALVLAGLPGFWYEAVLFASTSFFGPVAAYLLILVAYWCIIWGEAVEPNLRQACVAGALLAAVVMIRFHLLPEVLVVLLAVWRYRKAYRQVFCYTFLACLLALGLLDWLTWSYPFQSILRNIAFNIFHGAASQFGVKPFYGYGLMLWHKLGWVLPVVVLAIAYVARKYPLLFVLLLVNVLSFSVIAHKEYRFIFLTVMLWPMLVALAVAECMRNSEQWLRCLLALLVIASVVASMFVGLQRMSSMANGQIMAATVQAGELARQQYHGELQAFIVDQGKDTPALYVMFAIGGYAYFNVDVPVRSADFSQITLSRDFAAKPTMLMTDQPIHIDGLRKHFCRGRYCVYTTKHGLLGLG